MTPSLLTYLLPCGGLYVADILVLTNIPDVCLAAFAWIGTSSAAEGWSLSVTLAASVAVLGSVHFGSGPEHSDHPVERFRHWLRNQQAAAFVTDGKGVMIAANSLLETVIPDWRQSEPTPPRVMDLLMANCLQSGNSQGLEQLQKALADGIPPRAESVAVRLRNLKSIEVSVAPQLDSGGQAAYWLWSLRDNTDHHRLQQHHEHSEKMQAIMRFAGGMAHEFNNLLTVILGNMELLRAKPELRVGQVLPNVEAAEVASMRASQLIHELRTFASRDAPVKQSQSVIPVIRKVRRILSSITSENIQISYSHSRDSELYATINAAHLEDALLKLGLHAVETIGAKDGRIHFEAGVLHSAKSSTVTITISDDGQKLPASSVEKAFEPFATRRDFGESFGLSMAMAYGLLEEIGAAVSISESPAEGNRLIVSLPMSAPPEGASLNTDSSVIHLLRSLSVAVIDGESSVRKVASGMLRLLGHKSKTFESGRSFLEKMKAGTRYDLILMDSGIPGTLGQKTYETLRTVDPDVPVVICTSRSINLADFCPSVDRQPDARLAKPYSIADLASVISPFLQANSASASSS